MAEATQEEVGAKEPATSDPKTPVTPKNLMTHGDVHPIVLDFAMLKYFGTEWFNWDTSTIWQEIHRTFNSQISELTRNKLQAVKTLHVSKAFWNYWPAFEKIVHALNGVVPTWMVQQVPSLEYLYAAVDMAEQVRKEPYSEEVKRYIAAGVLHEDVTYVTPPLDFVQAEVSHPMYKCNDCQNEYSALHHDGICDSCTHKMDPEQGLSLEPMKEDLEKGYGQSMSVHFKFDPRAVEARYHEVKKNASEELKETAEDTQVGKILYAEAYMNMRREQLVKQLTSMKSWMGN